MESAEAESFITAKQSDSSDAGSTMPLPIREEQWRFCRRWFPLMAVVMAIPLLFMALFRTRVGPVLAPGRNGKDGKVRIAVVVMPSPSLVTAPMTRMDRLMAIRDTWAQDLLSGGLDHGESSPANRVVFVLDGDDPAVSIALEDVDWKLLEEDQKGLGLRTRTGSDSRVLVAPKSVSRDRKDGDSRLRHVLAKVSRAYDPDFIFLCTEYTFVVAENLRCFVRNFNPAKTVYVGNRFREKDWRAWINPSGNITSREADVAMLNAGGAGVLLSRGSLSLLREAWDLVESSAASGQVNGEKEGKVNVSRHIEAVRLACLARSESEEANPGVVLTRCLEHYGVEYQDSTDRRGGQRFNLYGPVRVAQGFVDPWYRRVHGPDYDVWHNGLQSCSTEAVTFHYVGPAETRAMHHIMHNKQKFLEDGYERAFSMWPSSSSEELGAFTAVPRRGDQSFNLILKKIQICRGGG